MFSNYRSTAGYCWLQCLGFCLYFIIGLCLATAHAAPFDDCRNGDLVVQNTCLACRMIVNHDHTQLQQLLNSPYVTANNAGACFGAGFLHASLKSNNLIAYRILRNNGADVNLITAQNNLPLIYVLDKERAADPTLPINIIAMYQRLLDDGLNPNTIIPKVSASGLSIIAKSILQHNFYSCGHGGYRAQIIGLLVARAVNIHYIAPRNITLLHFAALSGNICSANLVQLLKPDYRRSELIANNEYYDDRGATPLDYSMSIARNIDHRHCIRVGLSGGNKHMVAQYLALVDPEFRAEYDAKKFRNIGSEFYCSHAEEYYK